MLSLSDVAEKAEGSLMLHSINELREHHPPSPVGGANVTMTTTPIYHTLALLHTVLGEHDKVIHVPMISLCSEFYIEPFSHLNHIQTD